MTDVNGWQTAWGYDDGALAPASSSSSVADFRRDLREANERLTEPRERQLLREFEAGFADFMRLDERSWNALQARARGRHEADPARPRARDLRGRRRGRRSGSRPTRPSRRGPPRQPSTTLRMTCARRLVAVALGAAVVIVLLLLTASDLARMALEGERQRRAPQA